MIVNSLRLWLSYMINLKSSIKVVCLCVDNFVSGKERHGKSNLNRKPWPPLCLAFMFPLKLITNSTKLNERWLKKADKMTRPTSCRDSITFYTEVNQVRCTRSDWEEKLINSERLDQHSMHIIKVWDSVEKFLFQNNFLIHVLPPLNVYVSHITAFSLCSLLILL